MKKASPSTSTLSHGVDSLSLFIKAPAVAAVVVKPHEAKNLVYIACS